jgi:hypothetical protein
MLTRVLIFPVVLEGWAAASEGRPDFQFHAGGRITIFGFMQAGA